MKPMTTRQKAVAKQMGMPDMSHGAKPASKTGSKSAALQQMLAKRKSGKVGMPATKTSVSKYATPAVKTRAVSPKTTAKKMLTSRKMK